MATDGVPPADSVLEKADSKEGAEASTSTETSKGNGSSSGNGRPHAKSLNGVPSGGAQFPPPKTDKPRPHICATCTRSFARLEHLKRHERSHTKEKPFECPECTRCFARRDLLLRHQQKLHLTAMPSSRQRGGRRESTSSAAGGSTRIRKSSVANNTGAPVGGSTGGTGTNSMRPRANTISHVDNATLGMLAAANSSVARPEEMSFGARHFPSHHGLPGVGSYSFRGMSTATGNHGNTHVLPKIDTQSINMDMGTSLRTAPPYGGFGHGFDMQNIWYGPGTTVNPAQLHFVDSPQSLAFDAPASPYQQGFTPMPAGPGTMEEDKNFGWLHGFDHDMSFGNANEQAIDNSSPSAHSSGSHDGMSEVMLDGSNHSTSMWQPSIVSQALQADYSMELSGSAFPDLFPPAQLSPKSVQNQLNMGEQYFSSPPPMNSQTPLSMLRGFNSHFYHPPMAVEPETPSNSAASTSSSNHHSSTTSISTDSITDATRQAMLSSLSQHSVYAHHRKGSQPAVSSPLSHDYAPSHSMSSVPLPSTYDLQRYVAAYIQYFHPHLPFLHVSTLSFDSPVFTSSIRVSSGHPGYDQSVIMGGGGALILAMAAIGAFYEYETTASKDLFELAKKMIHTYLEERRKVDLSDSMNGSTGESPTQTTPLWLVQAMLLNVIYGHNCGDKTSAGIASTLCAALVSLARAAELAVPSVSQATQANGLSVRPSELEMGVTEETSALWNKMQPFSTTSSHSEWCEWKIAEERKRTLYAIFILSSLLVSAYNHAPAMMNSEIRLNLPCDEELWAADSAESWQFLGGSIENEQRSISFASALSNLLTASHREQYQQHHMSQSYGENFGSGLAVENLPESEIRPSTFGCLILINALHNYIWETRQRHVGRQWTTQETDSMHGHIEPALRAWQAAWASNPQHRIERPNPSGIASLSADCIPLLDLAYVRLFVNLGPSKEAFFRRDFDAMADELAEGLGIVQHADYSGSASPDHGGSNIMQDNPTTILNSSNIKVENQVGDLVDSHGQEKPNQTPEQSSKRERHLRKAAFYAAHSLAMSDKFGVTFADLDSRELPISSVMCVVDCAQVIAEWISTVQQRVGRYLGVLGKDEIDFTQVPAIMLLEDEDIKLLEKINGVMHSAEVKLSAHGCAVGGLSSVTECGYGSKVLAITALMLEKAAVWPVTLEAAQSLRTQAAHVQQRASFSVTSYL